MPKLRPTPQPFSGSCLKLLQRAPQIQLVEILMKLVSAEELNTLQPKALCSASPVLLPNSL